MKNLLLSLTLLCLSLCFISCSSDDEDKKPPSDSLRSCDLWIVKNNDYSTKTDFESGSYNRSTHTLTANTKDGVTHTFIFEFEEDKKVQTVTYNGVRYILDPTQYFHYYESDASYADTDFPHYGISASQTTVYSNEGTLKFNGDISFYQ